jgi:hypothetical protein
MAFPDLGHMYHFCGKNCIFHPTRLSSQCVKSNKPRETIAGYYQTHAWQVRDCFNEERQKRITPWQSVKAAVTDARTYFFHHTVYDTERINHSFVLYSHCFGEYGVIGHIEAMDDCTYLGSKYTLLLCHIWQHWSSIHPLTSLSQWLDRNSIPVYLSPNVWPIERSTLAYSRMS